MNNSWDTITLFISSTFADMQSERDYLRTYVFPLIQTDLKEYAISLRVIDLRWGVNTLDETDINQEGEKEKSIETKIIRVCFDEIDRSKPFFLGLLGERYGWIPSENQTSDLSEKYHVSKGSSITSMEIEYGVLNNKDTHCLFFEREKSSYDEMPKDIRYIFDDKENKPNEKTEADAIKRVECIRKLQQLKNTITATLKERNQEGNYYTYKAQWTADKFAGFEKFGQDVRQAIVSAITSYVKDKRKDESITIPEKKERMLQDEFIYERSKILVTREDLVNSVKDELINKNYGIILTGYSGQGKSSIYTSLVTSLSSLPLDQYLVLYHSAGINPESQKIFNMLKRWIYETSVYLNSSAPEVNDVEQCLNCLKGLFKKIPSRVKIILLIDSLDSFHIENTSRYLTFFPKYEYRDISMFCTSTPGPENYVTQYNSTIKIIQCPTITENEARTIILSFFDYYRKEVHKDVIQTLMNKRLNDDRFAYTSPLWLVMAMQLLLNIGEEDFAEAKLIDSKSEEEKIKEFQKNMILEFPTDPKLLFRNFLNKMKSSYGSLPEKVFLLIAASYRGINEFDLQEIVGEEWDPVTFALIHSFFALFLIEQGNEKKWQLAHQELKRSFTEEEKEAYYPAMCQYFWESYKAAPSEVRDNLLYYLYNAGDIHNASIYISENDKADKDKERIAIESLQLLDAIGVDEFIGFLDKICDSGKYRSSRFRKLKEMLSVGNIKELIRDLTARLRFIGEYEKALAISKFYADKILNSKMFGDFKMMLYIVIVHDVVEAVEGLRDREEREKIYESILATLRIKGLITLILVPICKRYYKWELFKLHNKE